MDHCTTKRHHVRSMSSVLSWTSLFIQVECVGVEYTLMKMRARAKNEKKAVVVVLSNRNLVLLLFFSHVVGLKMVFGRCGDE